MPQVTVYVREDDMPKWKAIEKKAEFMHHALNEISDLAVYGQHKLNEFGQKNGLPKLTVVEETFTPKPPDPDTGYPCCTKAKPCKHWEYDGLNGQWVNSLTGKTREVA